MASFPSDPSTRYRLLVVDDDPETARLVRAWFSGQPYEVLAASDGEEGVRRARAERPDLILMDLKMPGVDGISAARTLKSSPETRQIPIVLLTACRAVDEKVEAFAVGADDYVTKPFELEEVDARIRGILHRREALALLEGRVLHLTTHTERLEEMLVLDEKTGLANFRQFQKRLREEWRRAERYANPLSLVMIDLDDFKRVNDTLGHPAGDRCLQELATLILGGARDSDLAARYGGEEFAIVLTHTEGSMALRVAERIRAAVEGFVFLEDVSPLRLTVSAGVATYPSFPSVDSPEALLLSADRALYRAKAAGKNTIVADDGLEGGGRRVAGAPEAAKP
jgi:two-component system cell cycle response regulator